MKKALAIIIAALMLVAVFCAISVSAEENELLKIEVTDDSIIITAEGDFGYTDWIGFYPATHTNSYEGSTIWWYLGTEGGVWELPDDEDVVQRNTAGVFDETGALVPGKYFAILLANVGYGALDDLEPVFFEIKDYQEKMSRDQVTVDGVDKAAFGGNPEITDISENLYSLVGKQIRFWGWYGNDKALDKYGIRIDGGEMQYFDRYEAQDIVDHVKGVLKKDEVFASRFEIMVDITEGKHTAEIYAIAEEAEIETLVWTVNYRALAVEEPTEVPTEVPTEAPTKEPTQAPTAAPEKTEAPATAAPTDAPKTTEKTEPAKKDGSNTGLIIGIICGVIVVAAIVAAILISKKKSGKAAK